MDEDARLHEKMLAMNEELLLGSLRQHELTDAADRLNEQLQVEITERKRIELKLKEAVAIAENANRAKSEFLANMSHEIRTPLHVIIGLGHLLRRDLVDPAQHERLDDLCATADHLLSLINDFLDLSKIEAQRLTLDHSNFSLGTVVDKVVRMIEERAQEKGLVLTVEVTPQLRGMLLYGDPLRLAQVLINLCGNAVKFTDRGTVNLRIDCPAENADCVTLRFAVKDSGVGIAPEDQIQLFQPFTQIDSSSTREYSGTGLGLSISQHMVALMGGTIHVDSELGTGSIFSFEIVIPRATASMQEASDPVVAITANFDGKSVLFAEDNLLSQKILLQMLEDLGCVSDVASDGAAAVACAQERHYDFILMDMQMPKMDGLAATRAIRALPWHRDTPIMALTANAFSEDCQRCLDAGMNGHLVKPVTPAALAAALNQWLPQSTVTNPDRPDNADNIRRTPIDIPGLKVSETWRSSPERQAKYYALLDRFVKTNADSMMLLRGYLIDGENDAAVILTHQIRGSAGLMGAHRIASLVGEIEQGLRSGAGEADIASLIDTCEAELASLENAVGTRLVS